MSLFLLLILACPLMMFFMMRGMHGGHGRNADSGHAHGSGCEHDHADTDSNTSLDELHRQREQLDRQIEQREAEEQTPVGGGWR
jgi:Protein of unknown function (DUF2933)